MSAKVNIDNAMKVILSAEKIVASNGDYIMVDSDMMLALFNALRPVVARNIKAKIKANIEANIVNSGKQLDLDVAVDEVSSEAAEQQIKKSLGVAKTKNQ